jgi:hypothetical protein
MAVAATIDRAIFLPFDVHAKKPARGDFPSQVFFVAFFGAFFATGVFTGRFFVDDVISANPSF